MFTRFEQEYEAGKTKHSLQKEANLIKQKYMTQETAVQNYKIHFKSSNKKENTEESRVKQCLDNSTVTLQDHQ